MRIIFIRHGETLGNTQKRYIGKTDEPLSKVGIINLKSRTYPDCDVVVTSPMKRCIQTADIIYGGKKRVIYEQLRECDFGDFEEKNYSELSGSPEYQKWIDSGGRLPFPNGEAVDEFKERCIRAFESAVTGLSESTIAFVVHGGTIMSIFERYCNKNYYDYMLKNGAYYVVDFNGKAIEVKEQYD